MYDDWRQDEQVAQQVLAHHGDARYAVPLILEGGSIHVDGEGTLLTTAECLLNLNHNPSLSKAEIEKLMRDYLNISTIIWLEEGVYNDETDGHIDNMCCFVRPGEVALHWTDNEMKTIRSMRALSRAAYQVLSQARDAQGRALKIWKLPAPGPLYATKEEAGGVASGDAIERLAGCVWRVLT